MSQSSTFKIHQKVLLPILASMQPICTKRTTLDTTASIFFQVTYRELILKSTDLEISLQANCLLEHSSAEEPQTFLVSGKRMFDIVKELDDEITCTFASNQVTLQSGTIQLALHVKPAQEFPPFPERIENLLHIDSAFLIDLFEKVAFLIPQNNTNPALNGLLMELGPSGLKMTTTDGHCLAQVHTPRIVLETEHTWLLPRRAVFEMKKIVENNPTSTVFIGLCGNQLVFSGQSFNFFTKLLSEQFPQYQSIIQHKDFIPAVVDKTHFVKTLRRSACLLSGQFLATQLSFHKDQVFVTMHNKEVGKQHESLQLYNFDNNQIDIRFYAPYLLHGIQVFPDARLTCYLKNGSRPIIFQSEQEAYKFLYLVMPVSPTTSV